MPQAGEVRIQLVQTAMQFVSPEQPWDRPLVSQQLAVCVSCRVCMLAGALQAELHRAPRSTPDDSDVTALKPSAFSSHLSEGCICFGLKTVLWPCPMQCVGAMQR